MNKNGVKALVTFQDKILLSLRDDIPTIPWPNTWDWLGGGLENEETAIEGLQRELMEEISVVPKNICYLGVIQRGDGSLKHRAFVVMNDEEAKQILMGDEGQDLQWFTLDQTLKLALPDGFRWFLEHNYAYLSMLLGQKAELNAQLFVLE